MIRFYNGLVMQFDNGVQLTGDEVHVDGNRIVYVGPEKRDGTVFEREINLNGNILMPGFKNSHTHTPMTFLRSLADDLPLDRWLRELVWPNEAKLDDDAIYYLTQLGILEYLTSGITASFDMYYHLDAYVSAHVDSGFRTVMCSGLNDFDDDPEKLERNFLKYNSISDLVGFRMGIHAEYTTCMERMQYVSSMVHKYKTPFWTHLSETKSETDGCIQRYGKTTAQLLDSLGLFDYGGGGYHCVWFNDEDIDLFARKGLWVVTNPSSNLKLASGIAPLKKMLDKGVGIAIGTDGAASNNALDMFREMFLVVGLQSVVENDPTAVAAGEVLKMACVNGARCMGLNDCDAIAVGKKADLTVIDMSRPNMRPVNNPCDNLVFSGSKENILLTMVNGKILYENGEFFIGTDPEEIYRKSEEFMTKVRA